MIAYLAQGADIAPVFLQYGAIGAVALLAMWWAWTMYKRETARSDRLEADLRKQTELFAEKVIPALTQNTDALARFLRATRRDDG